MLNNFSFFKTHPVHKFGYTFTSEEAHKVIFKRDVELGTSRVSLASCTTTQLAVNTSGIVTLCTYNGQTTGFLNFLAQFYISTTTCHVGGYGNNTRVTCFSNNIGF